MRCSGSHFSEVYMKLRLAGGLAAIGFFALTAHSQAAVLTIDFNNYASAVDTTPDVTQATMTVTDVAGGVKVDVTLDAATFFAVTGGGHITVAWNLDKPEGAITGLPASPTFTFVATSSPPGCAVSCGTFVNTGLQGTWTGTSNHYAGPLDFMIAGITTADFVNNGAGFMAAVDVLGPAGTGEVAGTGMIAVPEPSSWAMMLLGFAGLGYAAWRGGRKGGVSIIEA
jgi:hypothetical protein